MYAWLETLQKHCQKQCFRRIYSLNPSLNTDGDGFFWKLGDGELFFEPKFCVIQVKLVISNGETDGMDSSLQGREKWKFHSLGSLCIYPICSSPSYLAILLYYDSMCLKWNILSIVFFAFCFSESGIFYSIPFSWSTDCIYLYPGYLIHVDQRQSTSIYLSTY